MLSPIPILFPLPKSPWSNMATKPDITINLPAEYYDALLEVFAKGLKHAKIKREVRKELRDWWNAERALIGEELDKQNE